MHILEWSFWSQSVGIGIQGLKRTKSNKEEKENQGYYSGFQQSSVRTKWVFEFNQKDKKTPSEL